jgi:hypothetical protein
MSTRMMARDLGDEAPHSLGNRIARFAMATNGRTAQYVSKSYWKQAKRVWTGELDTDPKEAVLRSAPDSERWHMVAGLTGHDVSNR